MRYDRIKILFVTPCFEEGGGERFLVNLLNRLDRSRFLPSLLCWRVHESHFFKLLPKDLKIYNLNRQRRFRYDLPRLIVAMVRLLRYERPNIVVSMLNEWHIALFTAVKMSGLHPAVFLDEQGGISDWLNFIRNKEAKRVKMVKSLYKRYLKWADLVVCASVDIERDFIQNFGANKDKIRTINNPIDIKSLEELSQEEVNHPWFYDDVPIVISVGRLTPRKGYKFLVKAFSRVIKECPSRLVLVADGPERPELEKLISDLGLDDSAKILGYQSNPFKYVTRAKVFVFPSFAEGFGYVAAEAMALGIPVVASNCAGPAEVLGYGKYGLLVPPGDDLTLARSILKLLRDEKLWHTLSQLGKQCVEFFSIERITREYEILFLQYTA